LALPVFLYSEENELMVTSSIIASSDGIFLENTCLQIIATQEHTSKTGRKINMNEVIPIRIFTPVVTRTSGDYCVCSACPAWYRNLCAVISPEKQ
jgi:hypothetical protein